MANILFISHRFPYPPDRGEKIRGWHLLRHMAKSHRVFLGCLVDDPRDWQHQEKIRPFCAELGAFAISKRRQKVKALLRLRAGRPLMLDYYRSVALHRWAQNVLARERIDIGYIYSTAMAPYLLDVPSLRRVLDMQDVDSEKWREYAKRSCWPLSLGWAREGRLLLKYEKRAALGSECTLLVSEAEALHLEKLAPELHGRVGWLEQGVDLASFDPAVDFPDPYPHAGPWLSFTGNMDYWPNADAAIWFAQQVLPVLRLHMPQICFAIVGANPGKKVQALASLPGVLVTGRVADVRPYVAAAAVSVAPLRIARGIQNKVLEAMALARPIVATNAAVEGIRATPGQHLLVADDPNSIARAILAVLSNQYPHLGTAARSRVEEVYSWPSILKKLDVILSEPRPARASLAQPTDSTSIA